MGSSPNAKSRTPGPWSPVEGSTLREIPWIGPVGPLKVTFGRILRAIPCLPRELAVDGFSNLFGGLEPPIRQPIDDPVEAFGIAGRVGRFVRIRRGSFLGGNMIGEFLEHRFGQLDVFDTVRSSALPSFGRLLGAISVRMVGHRFSDRPGTEKRPATISTRLRSGSERSAMPTGRVRP